MEKKEFLNEESYQRTNTKVKRIGNILIIIGLLLLGIGIILLLAGFLGFGNLVFNGIGMGQEGIENSKIFSGMSSFVIGMFMIGPGTFITVIGLIVRFAIGNRREIKAYTTQQTMPITQEIIDKMAPTVGNAVGTVGKELAKGIVSGIEEGMKDEKK